MHFSTIFVCACCVGWVSHDQVCSKVERSGTDEENYDALKSNCIFSFLQNRIWKIELSLLSYSLE